MSFQRYIVFLEKQVKVSQHVHDKYCLASEEHKQSNLVRKTTDQHMTDKARERHPLWYRCHVVFWLAISNIKCQSFIFLMT